METLTFVRGGTYFGCRYTAQIAILVFVDGSDASIAAQQAEAAGTETDGPWIDDVIAVFDGFIFGRRNSLVWQAGQTDLRH